MNTLYIKIFLFLLVYGFTYMLWSNQKLFGAAVHQQQGNKVALETADRKSLLELIDSKLEYPPRRVPETKEILQLDPKLFSAFPPQFLPSIKNPCWHKEFSIQPGSNPYRNNMYGMMFTEAEASFNKIPFTWQLQQIDGKQHRLRCLPYFFIIGQQKCGTTDLYRRLQLHPEIYFSAIKEPDWWTLGGFKNGSRKSVYGRIPVKDYLDLFDPMAWVIQEGINKSPFGNDRSIKIIAGDASTNTMDLNSVWNFYVKNFSEPKIVTADVIHAVQPGAKFIAILRDPVERLYSDYLYFGTYTKTAKDFHLRVVQSLQLFQSCLSEMSLRACVYNKSLRNSMKVSLWRGIYVVFYLDWLSVFNRDQLLLLCTEEYSANITGTIGKVLEFLSVGPFPVHLEAEVLKMANSNTRREEGKSAGSALSTTYNLLREFYQPFNHKLARVLENKAFLWSSGR